MDQFFTSTFKPEAGRFLISEPFMEDLNFQRTVVYLVEHNDKGSLGFVLNRKLDIRINQLLEDLPEFEAPVFMGGPVEQNTLHYIHRLGEELEGSQQLGEGIYWGGDFEDLKERIKLRRIFPSDILFFVGYSGWGENQLVNELDANSWIVAPGNKRFIFGNTRDNLWREILKSMGPKYQIISNYPTDPSLN